jgi:hypothetical protein
MMGWTCGSSGEGKKYVQILAGNPGGNQVTGKPRKCWEDINVNLWETSWQKGR